MIREIKLEWSQKRTGVSHALSRKTLKTKETLDCNLHYYYHKRLANSYSAATLVNLENYNTILLTT